MRRIVPSLARKPSRRGQALVEFGLVIGLFMLVIGGIVQFGIIFWSQNAITQISRDTARYAVTISNSPCNQTSTRVLVRDAANELANGASLVSYRTGMWATTPTLATLGPEGVGVDWASPDSTFDIDCPPLDNSKVWTVTVQVNHVVPIFIPGFQLFAPACASPGFCLSSKTELRMEPKKP